MTQQKNHWHKTPKPQRKGLTSPGVPLVVGDLNKHRAKPVKYDKPAYEPKITVCPGHPGFDARYTVPPGEQVYGAGFAAVGIGRDIDTRRVWDER